MTATTLPLDADAGPLGRVRRPRKSKADYITIVAVVVLLVVTLFPFYWSLRTAFSSNKALPSNTRSLLPADFTLSGFRRALGIDTATKAIAEGGSGAEINFLLALRNSFIVSTMVTIGQIVCCSMAAYAFARLKFPGRNALFVMVLTALMIPPIFTMLPNYLFVKDLGLLQTHLGIAAPTLLMTPFAIFFLRQFFLGIPREIEEAATIDGAAFFETVANPCSSAVTS